jgi:Ger(x)C family germination protein
MFLPGCMDASEIDDNVYAVAIGLDKGTNNKVIVTVQYPIYRSSKGGGGGGGGSGTDTGGGGGNVHSVEAPTLLEGIDLMNMAISRRVSLTHTKMLIISEDFARAGIGEFLSPLAKFRETRRTMFVVVTKGRAMDLIEENKTNIGESTTKAIELMMAQSKSTGFFPGVSFHEFYKDIISSYGEAIAIYAGVNHLQNMEVGKAKEKPPIVIERDVKPGELPRFGTGKREFVGTALFSGDKMVGSLNPFETRYLLMITGRFKRGMLSLQDSKAPGSGIALSLRQGRATKISGRFVNGRPVIDVNLNIEADIGAIHSRINYESANLIEDLNQQLKKKIKEGATKTIEKTKKEYKTDVFEFGKKLAGYFPTIQEWEKYDWLSKYPEAKVNVKVEANVRRTGLTIYSTPIQGGLEYEE